VNGHDLVGGPAQFLVRLQKVFHTGLRRGRKSGAVHQSLLELIWKDFHAIPVHLGAKVDVEGGAMVILSAFARDGGRSAVLSVTTLTVIGFYSLLHGYDVIIVGLSSKDHFDFHSRET
jgi:hypothetical protein